jgi:hypothetical protein
MRKSINVPTIKMIEMLNNISSGGRIRHKITSNSNTSKISFLFRNEISTFYTHYTLTRNILINSTNLTTAVNYQILFKRYISEVFSMFFKIKMKSLSKKRKIAPCIVKCLPNYKLLIKVKHLINLFMKEEEVKFNLNKTRKNMFVINSFLDSDDETTTVNDSKKEDENFKESINNINKINENC